MSRNDEGVQSLCSFCGRSPESVGPCVEGRATEHSAFICQDCVVGARTSFRASSERQKSLPQKLAEAPTPRDLVSHLDSLVVGQDLAKRKLAVAVANHYLRMLDASRRTMKTREGALHLRDVVIEKSNVLLIGPTGTGKTLLARALAEKLNVPFAIADATTLTEAGYVGDDVENILLKLIYAADFDLEHAEQGIIFIDEVDKLRKSRGNVSIQRDVGGEGVQQSLLKLVEGTVCRIPPHGGRKHPEQQCIEMDTTNILFICGGAFTGLEEIVRRRLGRSSLGFHTSQNGPEAGSSSFLQHVIPEDLEQYGFIPELVGRLPVVAPLHDLTIDNLASILTEPRDALLKQYEKLASFRGCQIEFTSEAVNEIAALAHARKMGARGLRSVVEELMLNMFFNLPQFFEPGDEARYVITRAMVVGKERMKRTVKRKAVAALHKSDTSGAAASWR